MRSRSHPHCSRPNTISTMPMRIRIGALQSSSQRMLSVPFQMNQMLISQNTPKQMNLPMLSATSPS